jgi:hypothetical protein
MNSILKFYFQPSFSGWMPTSIFQGVYDYYKSTYGDMAQCDNTSVYYNNNSASRTGPHHLIIENSNTKKYIVISYWDMVYELLNDYNGWNNKNCLGIYSSVNAKTFNKITASSYCCYNTDTERKMVLTDKNILNKPNDKLFFRGYLHGHRYSLRHSTFVSGNKILLDDYIKEIASYKIGLSLNGVAEICNRDMEILGVGSVLLRPKLIQTEFHNSLIPDIHYVSFDLVKDSKLQEEIILEKYNQILKDKEYMLYIATNGLDWYNKNGSRAANIEILRKIINIQELL